MKSQPIRIALIEPNRADVHWFCQSAKEAGLDAEVIHFSTGITALDEWTHRGDCTADLIVVADVLPMLTAQDFIDTARALRPDIRVVITGERTPVPMQVDGDVERYTKPLSG